MPTPTPATSPAGISATGSFSAASNAPAPAPQPVRGTPAQFTSFVGREREIETARRLLAGARLLTLTGAGGSGKTRLAVEAVAGGVAWDGMQGGAWVELAPIADPALVPQAILAALGASDQSDVASLVERVAQVIAERELLLVLDNCEHLVDACAAIADTLLRRCGRLRILATSREALGVTGETAWLVPPLTLPAAGGGADGAGGDEAESVRLFVERARAVQPAFTLTAATRAAVAQICRRLDGLPLALELAAARLRVLRPEQIAARLDDRFRLLSTGNRAALPRHQTLRAAIDWSYDLLAPHERRLLARLSVFSGGFTLEAAERICSSDTIPPADVLDIVSELVEKSLVDMREAGDSARYALLETVRQYAADRLEEFGEVGELRRQHAEYFYALAEEAEPHLSTTQRPRWIPRLQAELDNLRLALAWTRERDDERHVRLVGMLHWFWFATGDWPEARQWLKSALTCDAGQRPTRDRAAVQFSAGAIASLQARPESALAHLLAAEELAASLGEHRLLAYARNYHAMALTQTGSPEALAPIELAHAWFRESGDLYGLRLNLLLKSIYLFSRGDIANALDAGEEAVRIARVFGLQRELAIALQTLGQVVVKQGDIARAIGLYRDALVAIREDSQPLFLSRAMELLACCLGMQGSHREAARIYGAASGIREVIGARMWQLDKDAHAPVIAACRAGVGEATYDAEYGAGRALGVEQAVDFAIRAAATRTRDDAVEPTTDTAEWAVFVPPAPVPQAGAGLRAQSLGSVEVWVDGVPVPRKAWGYAKVRELLFYLLLHPEGRTREQVGAALWPEASATQVRNNYHVTMHTLRKALGGAHTVRFERDRYRLDMPGGVELDATRFEARITAALKQARRGAADAGELADALALFGGDFLDGEPAGDWHLELRDRLCRLYEEALEVLGNALVAQEQWEGAIAVFDRLVTRDPLHEGACRALMRCRARLGDMAGVAREYRRVTASLRRELDEEPSPETTALYRKLQGG